MPNFPYFIYWKYAYKVRQVVQKKPKKNAYVIYEWSLVQSEINGLVLSERIILKNNLTFEAFSLLFIKQKKGRKK